MLEASAIPTPGKKLPCRPADLRGRYWRYEAAIPTERPWLGGRWELRRGRWPSGRRRPVAACAAGVPCPSVGVGAATAGATVVVAAAAVGAIHVANFAEGVKHAMSEGEQQVAGSGSGAAGSGGHFSGSEKPRTSGATPNSIYTHVDPKTGKATQNAIYDGNGNVVGHVDFKNHGDGAPSGHGHMFPEPGNPASGHGPGKPHIPNDRLPPGWDKLPPNVKPNTPIGD